MTQRGKEWAKATGSVAKVCRMWRTSLGQNEELRKLEEALPRLKECELEKVSRLWDVTAFTQKVPMDLTKETR